MIRAAGTKCGSVMRGTTQKERAVRSASRHALRRLPRLLAERRMLYRSGSNANPRSPLVSRLGPRQGNRRTAPAPAGMYNGLRQPGRGGISLQFLRTSRRTQ